MKFNLLLVFSLVVSLTIRSLGQTEFSLAPCFGSGMVLQRSSNTILHGFGPKGTSVSLEFWNEERSILSGPAWSGVTKVDDNGHWQQAINLTAEKFQQANAHWLLKIFEKKNKRNRQEYTNILIGDVIIVAGWKDQVMSAGTEDFISETTELFQHHKEEVRFLDLTLAGDLADIKRTKQANWEKWPEDKLALDQYSTLTLRLAYELAETNFLDLSTNKYKGIVLTSGKVMEENLNSDSQEKPKGLAANQEYIWQWITQDAQKAQTNRSQTLIYNKRNNIVTNIPDIKAYESARFCSQDAFSPEKPPLRSFTFAGAILSSRQGEATRP